MPEAWNWFDEPCISLAGVQAQVANGGTYEDILLDIDSDGGIIEEGWRVYDYLKGLGVPINARSGGVVCSMATILFGLGSTRLLSPHAKFMAHQPGGGMEGNINDFRTYLAELETEQARMLSVYATMTGKSEEDIASLLIDGQDHYFTAQESITYGWATGLYENTAEPATANRTRKPIMAHLSDGRKGLGLPTEKPTTQTNNKLDMATIMDRAKDGFKYLQAFMEGKKMVALMVDTADGKKLDITTADGETYAINNPVKFEDGSDVPDGEYTLSDGIILTITGGVITDIQDPAQAVVEAPAEEEPTASAVDADTVTISKTEFDRLTALETAHTAMSATVEQHTAMLARMQPVLTAAQAALSQKESADPKVARLPETPIDKRTAAPEDDAVTRKKERLAARSK